MLLLPHIYNLADYYTWLCGFSFSQLVEEQFEVAHHSHRPLPTLLHSCRFGHLQQTQRHGLVIENKDLYQIQNYTNLQKNKCKVPPKATCHVYRFVDSEIKVGTVKAKVYLGLKGSKQLTNVCLSQSLQTLTLFLTEQQFTKDNKAAVRLTHPYCPFIHGSDPPLRVDTQRALGLVRRYRTHSRSLIRTGYMAGEVTHWTRRQRNKRFDWSCIKSDWF